MQLSLVTTIILGVIFSCFQIIQTFKTVKTSKLSNFKQKDFLQKHVLRSTPPLQSKNFEAKLGSVDYPWYGGQINGYFLWETNFVPPVNKLKYLSKISQQQTIVEGSGSTTSYSVPVSGSFQYSSDIPPGFNCVVAFSGYSNANNAISNSEKMLTKAQNYFKGKENFLISLSFGGGTESGSWGAGNGAIYSIYEAVTKKGVPFSYIESATGNILKGTGTGALNNQYNSLLFDIETAPEKGIKSSGEDFLQLFNYIKQNPNSVFNGLLCIIIVSIAHSCSSIGKDVVQTLYEDKNGYYDYIQNQLYTQSVGVTNEYCANADILWNNAKTYADSNDSFQYYVSKNKNYQRYGNNIFLPAINFASLYEFKDSESYPNLYFYQSSLNQEYFVEQPSGYRQIDYPGKDTGVVTFYNSIMKNPSKTIGGYIQWVNGVLHTKFTG